MYGDNWTTLESLVETTIRYGAQWTLASVGSIKRK